MEKPEIKNMLFVVSYLTHGIVCGKAKGNHICSIEFFTSQGQVFPYIVSSVKTSRGNVLLRNGLCATTKIIIVGSMKILKKCTNQHDR